MHRKTQLLRRTCYGAMYRSEKRETLLRDFLGSCVVDLVPATRTMSSWFVCPGDAR